MTVTSGAGPFGRAMNFLSSFPNRAYLGYLDHRAAARLGRLSDAGLKDIGLTRWDVDSALARPLTGEPMRALRAARNGRRAQRNLGVPVSAPAAEAHLQATE